MRLLLLWRINVMQLQNTSDIINGDVDNFGFFTMTTFISKVELPITLTTPDGVAHDAVVLAFNPDGINYGTKLAMEVICPTAEKEYDIGEEDTYTFEQIDEVVLYAINEGSQGIDQWDDPSFGFEFKDIDKASEVLEKQLWPEIPNRNPFSFQP